MEFYDDTACQKHSDLFFLSPSSSTVFSQLELDSKLSPIICRYTQKNSNPLFSYFSILEGFLDFERKESQKWKYKCDKLKQSYLNPDLQKIKNNRNSLAIISNEGRPR